MLLSTVYLCWIVQVPQIGEQQQLSYYRGPTVVVFKILPSKKFSPPPLTPTTTTRSCPHAVRRLCVGSGSELRRPRFVAITTYRCRVRFRWPGIIVYLDQLKRNINAVFYLLPFYIQRQLKVAIILSLVQILAWLSRLKVLYISSMGYQFLIVIVLSPLQLIQNQIPLSGFLVRRIGAVTRDILGQINPLLRCLLIYFLITRSLFFNIRQGLLQGSVFLYLILMVQLLS